MVDNNLTTNIAAMKSNGSLSNLDYDCFINSISKKYKPSALREMAAIFDTFPKEKVNLGLGFPNAETFPFQSITVSMKDGTSLNIEGETLNTALQYGVSGGHSHLRNWLKQFQDKIHGPIPWKNYNLMLSCGSQEALFVIVSTLLEPGDVIIMQTPSYPGALGVIKPYNVEMIPLHADIGGVKIEPLRQLLKERSSSGKSVPKFLVVNPIGSNPSGVTIPEEEKEEIYKLACQYNFLIVEDDPYYFLNFSEKNPRSFLSMDSENRVVRFDSFSKIMSPGLRLGFITAPSKILDKMNLYFQSASVHPSSLSQIIVHEILKRWQYDGLIQHIREVKMFYQRNRNIMLQAIETHLKGLVDYVVPTAGFFIWLRLKCIKDSKHFAEKKCLKNFILVTPGFIFYDQDDKSYSHVRLSFSAIKEDQIDRIISVLASLIREEMANEK